MIDDRFDQWPRGLDGVSIFDFDDTLEQASPLGTGLGKQGHCLGLLGETTERPRSGVRSGPNVRRDPGHGHRRDTIWFGKRPRRRVGSMGYAIFVARLKFRLEAVLEQKSPLLDDPSVPYRQA